MSVETNKLLVRRVFDEAFNRGELAIIDESVAPNGVDHQHPNEPSFAQHLKEVVIAMRTAFPDLHFEVTEMLGEGDWVACYSVMTGTNTGELRRPLMLPPQAPPSLPATGRPVRVPHMHMIRFRDGRSTDLLHLMDTMAMVGQLGLLPAGGTPAARAA
jgi:predicted ester cyclase